MEIIFIYIIISLTIGFSIGYYVSNLNSKNLLDASNKILAIRSELGSHTNAEIFAFRLEDDLKYRKKYDITRLQEKINNATQ